MRDHMSAYDWDGITIEESARLVASVLEPIDVRVLRAVVEDPRRNFDDTDGIGSEQATRNSLQRISSDLKIPHRQHSQIAFRNGGHIIEETNRPSGRIRHVDPLSCQYVVGEFGRLVIDTLDGVSPAVDRSYPGDAFDVWRITEGQLAALRFLAKRPAAISRIVKAIGYHSWPEAAEGQQIVRSILQCRAIGEPHDRRPDGSRYVIPPLAIDVYGQIMNERHSRLCLTAAGLWVIETLSDACIESVSRPVISSNWRKVRTGRPGPHNWEW